MNCPVGLPHLYGGPHGGPPYVFNSGVPSINPNTAPTLLGYGVAAMSLLHRAPTLQLDNFFPLTPINSDYIYKF